MFVAAAAPSGDYDGWPGLTASELARAAGITPQSASSHLAQMTAVGLVAVEKRGRHRYHRLATSSVARMMESIMQAAPDFEPDRKRISVDPRDAVLRNARTCTTTSPDSLASRGRCPRRAGTGRAGQ
jgi:MarR family